MATMLEKSFLEASKLPNAEQNRLARWILGEIKADRKWDKLFSESEDILGKLAIEALDEDEQKKTNKLDISDL